MQYDDPFPLPTGRRLAGLRQQSLYQNGPGTVNTYELTAEAKHMDNSRDTIIIVDDNMTTLTAAKNSLSGKYNVFTAPSGEKMFLLLERVAPALVLLDIEMPGMDGYEALERMKNRERTAHIPVIFLTAHIDPESEIKGLNLGAVDYITKPFSRELLLKRIELHILFEKQRKELLKHNILLESEVDKKARMISELQGAILKTVAELVECRDNVTGGHIERTQRYLSLLVDFLREHGVYAEELDSWDIGLFIMSSQLHDVGKISIKDEILMKPGKLTDEEFAQMKKHAESGVGIIRRIEKSTTENAFLQYAGIMAGSHHEKWDGSGYPYGLKGKEIPLMGRLMALADVYDALTNDRPYKKAFAHSEAVDIIKNGDGTHFDPHIVEIFLAHEKEFERNVAGDAGAAQPGDGMLPAIGVVDSIVDARESRDQGHAGRVRSYLETLIGELLKHKKYRDEVSSWDMDLFFISARLHDVGNMRVADRILNKSDKLTESEYEDIKKHADFGVSVIRRIKEGIENEGLLYHAEVIAGSHHEKWDGTGYPHGLKGTEIPLQSRIMAIVDVYESLTTDRPHRKRRTHKEAVETIMSGSGTFFDPVLVDVFLDCEKEIENRANQL